MKPFILFFMFCFALVQAEAQISSVNLEMNTVPNNDPYAEVGTDGVPLPYHLPLLKINFSSLVDISRLYIKLGSSSGASDLKLKVFELGEPPTYEEDCVLGIQGNVIFITIGAFLYQGTYYAEVKGEMSDGSFTEVHGDSSP